MFVDSIKGQNKFIPCGDVQEAAVEGHPLVTSDHPHPLPLATPLQGQARPLLWAPSEAVGQGYVSEQLGKTHAAAETALFFFFFWKELKGKDFVLFLASL